MQLNDCLRRDYSTNITQQWLSKTPLAKWPKIKWVSTCRTVIDCCTVITWLYNYRGVPNALYALEGQCNRVVGLRHDYSNSITPKWLYNTPSGKMAKNLTGEQLNRSPTITTRPYNWRSVPHALCCLNTQSFCVRFVHGRTTLLASHVMAPQHPLWPNGQESNQCISWMAVTQ